MAVHSVVRLEEQKVVHWAGQMAVHLVDHLELLMAQMSVVLMAALWADTSARCLVELKGPQLERWKAVPKGH